MQTDRPLVPVRTYVIVYAILMALLLVNMAVAYLFLGRYWNNAIAEGIAAAQFMLVFLYFMHVKYYTHPLIRVFASAGLIWIAIMIILTLADYLTRNHPPGSTPRGEPVFVETR